MHYNLIEIRPGVGSTGKFDCWRTHIVGGNMKLYKVPRNTKVKVLEDVKVPPGAPEIKKGDIINFGHIDGMYSFCGDAKGNIVHLAAWTEVEIIDEMANVKR